MEATSTPTTDRDSISPSPHATSEGGRHEDVGHRAIHSDRLAVGGIAATNSPSRLLTSSRATAKPETRTSSLAISGAYSPWLARSAGSFRSVYP